MDVRYAGNEGGAASDLDWVEFENYGADSDVEQYLGNRAGAGDCEGLQSHADVEAFKVFAEDDLLREKGNIPRTFKQFRHEMRDIRSKYGFQK